MFIPDPDLDFSPSRIRILIFTHPGSSSQRGTGSRISNTLTVMDKLADWVEDHGHDRI
jgi:hypothetical protein